jgi:dTDP-glucose 4,6-dehydratase
VVGTHALLKAARAVWLEAGKSLAHRFHHVSTDEVYGSLGPADPAFAETTPYAPNSPYSATKAASDHLVRAYHHTYGLSVTTSNCSNNYGPRHFPEKLIPLIIVNILRGLPLPIYGDGRNVRDWLHVEDHCRGIDLVLSRGAIGEVYNIGGGSEAENISLVRLLCGLVDEAFGRDAGLAARYPQAPPAQGKPASSLITFVKDRAGHDRRYAIDCSKASRDVGYEAAYTLERGLRETVDWYLENEAWWRAILAGKHQEITL